ncbi:MAG: hypothetical protein HFF18_08535 [Oscillospiraceae bacterium]|nr:hypothetical protein [Oscillospiraceae bacterium]
MSTCPSSGPFSAWAAQFFLEIRQDSCEKIVCQTKKFLAVGHIAIYQTRPKVLFASFSFKKKKRNKKEE